jgi:ABC-type transporter Mla subunit MlaD
MGQAGEVLDGAGETIKNAGGELAEMLSHLNGLLERETFKEGLAQTIARLPQVLGETEQLLRENRPQIKLLVENLSSSSNVLRVSLLTMQNQIDILAKRETFSKASDAVDSLAKIGEVLEELAEEDLEAVMASLRSMLEKGDQTMLSASEGVVRMNSLLSALDSKGDKAGGTLSQLINNGELYENINHFLVSGQALLSLLEEQPNSIIFGKKKRKSKPRRAEASGAGYIVKEGKD